MAGTALIVVDMLNPYDHRDADKLIESVETVVDPIARLIARAGDEGTQVIYVNDNYGDWDSSSRRLAETAMEGRRPDLVEPIVPKEGTPFVIKARHTIFYGTPLEYLLGQTETNRIVLVGQVTEQCILYSALDAYVRHIQVVVPVDAVAHILAGLADAALEMMRVNMDAEVVSAAEVAFDPPGQSRD
jgi:nicotinamidase-related amidase